MRQRGTSVSVRASPSLSPTREGAFRDSCICNFVFGLGARSGASLRTAVNLPPPALRACAPVANRCTRRSRAGFSPWASRRDGASLTPASRESLIASIEAAITAPTTPTEAMLELLAIAEYIERERPAAAA